MEEHLEMADQKWFDQIERVIRKSILICIVVLLKGFDFQDTYIIVEQQTKIQ